MSGFLLSAANQTFAALEQSYGQAASLPSAQQIVTNGVTIRQTTTPSRRRDKSGARSRGRAAAGRRQTAFEIGSFLISQGANGLPFCDPLFAAAMGTGAVTTTALTIASIAGQTFTTAAPHGLSIGSALSFSGEIRFTTNVPSPTTFAVNAPFSTTVAQNTVLSAAITYRLSNTLPSLTVFDYWGVQGSFSRLLTGAVIDGFDIDISGDRHEFRFTGRAADLIDSAAFVAGTAGLETYPQLPSETPVEYSIVPGHLGQVWLGNPTSLAYTLTRARIRLMNNVSLRDRELGNGLASASIPGRRVVEVDLSLLAVDDNSTAELYQIARNRGSMSVTLQLGQQSGQMMAVYLPSVLPEIPVYDDSGEWLAWHLTNSQAMGVSNDELYLAFA